MFFQRTNLLNLPWSCAHGKFVNFLISLQRTNLLNSPCAYGNFLNLWSFWYKTNHLNLQCARSTVFQSLPYYARKDYSFRTMANLLFVGTWQICFMYVQWQIYFMYHINFLFFIMANFVLPWKFYVYYHGNFMFISMANSIFGPWQFHFFVQALFSLGRSWWIFFGMWQFISQKHGKFILCVNTIFFLYHGKRNIFKTKKLCFYHGKFCCWYHDTSYYVES